MADPINQELPAGFTVDQPQTDLPVGFTLDTEEENIKTLDQSQSVGDRVLRQVGLTVRAAGEGVGGLVGIVSDPISIALRDAINFATDSNVQPQMLRTTISGLLTNAGIPEPETKTEEIVQNISQAVVGGGGAAGLAKGVAGVAARPVTKAVSGALATQPGAQVVGAGVGQAASELAREAGAGPVGQVGAALVGGVTGAGLTSKISGARLPAPIAEDVAATEARGIRVLTSDVKTPETFAAKWLQGTGEKIPVAGTGPVRVAQQSERVGAIRNTLREFGAEDTANLSDDIMGDLLRVRSDRIKRFVQAKDQVFANVADAGSVPVSRTVSTIDDSIAKLQSLGTEEMALAIAKLTDWKNSIQNQGIDNIEILRKHLGESFSAPELAAVKSASSKAINNIYKSLREDIGEFIIDKGKAGDHAKWKIANDRLAGLIGELDKAALKTALNKGDVTPEVVRSLLFSKKPSDIKALFKGLSVRGRGTARASILNEAAEKATTGGKLSPQKFMTQLEKMNEQFSVFFSGDDLKQVEGLQRALQLTERASVAGINPPTGQQLAIPVGAAVLTDLLGGAGAALATGGGLGGFARLYESRAVRNALINLSRTKAGSKSEAAVLKRLIAAAQSHKMEQEE